MAEPRKFRKQPVVIEAVQFLEFAPNAALDALRRWAANYSYTGALKLDGVPEAYRPARLSLPTLEGVMQASTGDWIIRGVQGEVYPCKPDIFEATYEAVES